MQESTCADSKVPSVPACPACIAAFHAFSCLSSVLCTLDTVRAGEGAHRGFEAAFHSLRHGQGGAASSHEGRHLFWIHVMSSSVWWFRGARRGGAHRDRCACAELRDGQPHRVRLAFLLAAGPAEGRRSAFAKKAVLVSPHRWLLAELAEVGTGEGAPQHASWVWHLRAAWGAVPQASCRSA